MSSRSKSKSKSKSMDDKKVIGNLERSVSHLQNTVDDLRTTLQKFQYLVSQNSPGLAAIGPPISPLLKKFPTEIRLKIYRYLLVNPQLGEAMWTGTNTEYGKDFKYHLSPNILRVCRTIYDEALPILYDNTFIFVCHRRNWKDGDLISHIPQCPLTRYISPDVGPMIQRNENNYTQDIFDFETVPNFLAVRRWKVITMDFACRFRDRPVPSKSLAGLLQAVCDSPQKLKEFTVKVVLSKPYWHPENAAKQVEYSKSHFTAIGKALGVLRNVEKADLGLALKKELPTGADHKTYHWPSEHPIYTTKISNQYTKIMTGNFPLERVFVMNQHLLSYAQSFERDPQFQLEMNPNFQKMTEQNNSALPSVNNNPFQMTERCMYTAEPCVHMVEDRLRDAMEASEGQDSVAFKSHRKVIINYLDPQYRRIVSAMNKLHQFIQSQKTSLGFFDPDVSDSDYLELICEQALEALEDTTESFRRDISSRMKLQLRKPETRATKYRFKYDDLPRERCIAQLATMFDHSADDMLPVNEFIEIFKLAADDMQKQYMEIRQARKNLYSADGPERPDPYLYHEHEGCGKDKPIDWSTDPEMFDD